MERQSGLEKWGECSGLDRQKLKVNVIVGTDALQKQAVETLCPLHLQFYAAIRNL